MKNHETLKQVLVSIFIGACVSFITTLLQGVVEHLQSIPAQGPGIIAGVGRYLHVLKSYRHG